MGLPPLVITLVMTFTALNVESTALKIFWACLGYGLYGAIGATMEYSSSTAQLANMTKNPDERSKVVAIKSALQNVAQIISAVVFIKMVRFFGGSNEAKGFFMAVLVIAVFLTVICIANIIITKKYELNRDGTYRSHLVGIGAGVGILQQIKDLVKIRPLVVLCGNAVVEQMLYAIRSGILIYIFQYYWSLELFYDQTILVYTIAMVVGALLLNPVIKLLRDTNCAFIVVKLITAVLFVVNFLMIKSMGAAASQASMQYGVVWVLFILSGLFLGLEMVFPFALMPGMVDYSEWQTGMNKGGMVHSLFGLTITFGSAVGGFIFGLLLENSGYVANAVQTAQVQNSMLSLAFIIPAVLLVATAVIQLFFGLNDKKLNSIIAEIAKRRESETTSR